MLLFLSVRITDRNPIESSPALYLNRKKNPKNSVRLKTSYQQWPGQEDRLKHCYNYKRTRYIYTAIQCLHTKLENRAQSSSRMFGPTDLLLKRLRCGKVGGGWVSTRLPSSREGMVKEDQTWWQQKRAKWGQQHVSDIFRLFSGKIINLLLCKYNTSLNSYSYLAPNNTAFKILPITTTLLNKPQYTYEV